MGREMTIGDGPLQDALFIIGEPTSNGFPGRNTLWGKAF
jgi:hypothetical protein